MVPERIGYTDVPRDAWYYWGVTLATWLGLVKGYPDGTFKPDQPITRAEAATVAVRVLGMAAIVSGAMALGVYYAVKK